MEAIKNFVKKYPVTATVILLIILYLLVTKVFKKKIFESSFKVDYADPKSQMRTMMGMGNYGSVLGCEGNKCY